MGLRTSRDQEVHPFVPRLGIVVGTMALLVVSAGAVREFVVLDEPQPAQRVEGVVLDPSESPIPEMTVTDRDSKWAVVLRSTKTDSQGRFHFSRELGKSIYYLRFDGRGWNPLGLKLKLDKRARQGGIVARPEIGG